MSPSLIRQVWLAPSSSPGHLPDKCLTQESPCAVKATRSGKGKVARSHPSPASDGTGAPGRCEHRASLRRQQPILCHLTGCWSHWGAQSSALAGGCCAGRCLCQAGYKAQTPLPTKQLGPWVRARHPDPPWLSLPPSQASPSPAGVACSISHCLTTMVKATTTSHRGHCGDHQFLMGLSLGLHLCHSTEKFPELLCSHSISSKLPSGACEDHEPAAASLSTLAAQAPGVGASAQEPEAWNGARLSPTCAPQPSASTVSTWPLHLSNLFHGACEPRKGKGIKRKPLTWQAGRDFRVPLLVLSSLWTLDVSPLVANS